jgi:hypothetical protein
LGAAAVLQTDGIRWLPGDEFEKAQQKMQSKAFDADEELPRPHAGGE